MLSYQLCGRTGGAQQFSTHSFMDLTVPSPQVRRIISLMALLFSTLYASRTAIFA